MNEKKLEKLAREAVSTNKLKTGFKEVAQYLKGTKLIVVSNSLGSDLEQKLRKSADENNITVFKYNGNSVSLGRLCNLSYGASVISLKNISEADVKELEVKG